MWVPSGAVRGFTRSNALRRVVTSGAERSLTIANEWNPRHTGTARRRKRPYPSALGSISPYHHSARRQAEACRAPAAVATGATRNPRHEALDKESKAVLLKLRGGQGKSIIKKLHSLNRSGQGLREEVIRAVLGVVMAEAEGKGGVVAAVGLLREAAEVGLLRDEEAMATVLTHCAHKGAPRVVWALLADTVVGKDTGGLPVLSQETLELVLVRLAEALETGQVASRAELGHMSVKGMLTAAAKRGWVMGGEAVNALVGVGAWARQWGEAMAVKAQLQAVGHQITDQTAVIMMRACQSSWSPQHAQAALAVALAAVGSSPIVPELALELSRRDGRLRDQGVEVVERRLQEGRLTHASTRLQQMLMHALAEIRSHRRTTPILEGLASIGCPLLEETWVWVLEEVVRSGAPESITTCQWVLKQMTLSDVPKTRRVYEAAIAATPSGHSPSTGLEWLRQMELQDGLKPDEACFMRYISGAARRGHVREACLGMEAMQRAGHKAALPLDTYTRLLQACQSGKRKGPEEALQVLAAMRGHGLRPSGHMHSLALQACKTNAAWDAALLLLLAMERQGPRPSVHDYTLVMQACGRAGRADEALYVLPLMQKRGLRPNASIILATMVALAKAQRPRDAEALLRSMRRTYGLTPGLWHYRVVIDAWAHADEAKPALQWLAAMKQDGILPSLDCLRTVASACSRAGEWEEACRLLHHLVLDSPDKAAGVLMNVILACGRQGAWPVACYLNDLNIQVQSDPTIASGGSGHYSETLNVTINSFDELTTSLFALECYDRVLSVGGVNHWSTRFPGMVDLHYFSRPLAKVAVTHVLQEMVQAHKDPKSVRTGARIHNPSEDLVLITGSGRKSSGGVSVLTPYIREYLERSLGLKTAPYIMGADAETTLGINRGRLRVAKESLQEYLRTR